jgi:hypothetical protein
MDLRHDEAAPALCQMIATLPALQELSIQDVAAAHFASSPAVLQRITSLTPCRGWLPLLQGQAASFKRRLHTLELVGDVLDREYVGYLSWFKEHAASLQRLHTLVIDSTVPFNTARVLCSCSQLRHLTVHSLQRSEGNGTLDSPPPALESLTITGDFDLLCVLQQPWLAKVS